MKRCIFVDSHGNAFYTGLLLIHLMFLLAVIAGNITDFTKLSLHSQGNSA